MRCGGYKVTRLDEGIDRVDESVSRANVHKGSAQELWAVDGIVPFAYLVAWRPIDLAERCGGFAGIPGLQVKVAGPAQVFEGKSSVQDVCVQKVPHRQPGGQNGHDGCQKRRVDGSKQRELFLVI